MFQKTLIGNFVLALELVSEVPPMTPLSLPVRVNPWTTQGIVPPHRTGGVS
jgi:hypothetical protein